MKSWAGRVTLLVGAFLLIAGAIAAFWAGGAAKRTPLDTDSWTRLTGEANGVLVNADDTSKVEPVKYWVHTQVDPDASTGDVVVFEETSCIMVDVDNPPTETCVQADDDRLVNTAREIFATDRKTAEAVADQAKFIPNSEVAYQGLINKFPFGTEKRDYDYWDGTLGTTVKAEFQEETEIDGLTVYKFQVTIPQTDTEISAGTDGTYEASQTLWVDPVTGAFINQEGSQILATTDGTVALDIKVAYTAETVAKNVTDTKANVKTLNMISVVLPIVGFVGGLLLIALGFFLINKNKKKSA